MASRRRLKVGDFETPSSSTDRNSGHFQSHPNVRSKFSFPVPTGQTENLPEFLKI